MFIIEALWFFLPAVIANMCPGFATKLNFPGSFPVNVRLFGSHKTWAAWYAGVIGSVFTVCIQTLFQGVNTSIGLFDYDQTAVWVTVGLLFGIGAIAGDQGKSFFKRRRGIAPGDRWWPFDQLDFVVGSLLLTMPVVGWIGWQRIAAITITILIVHRPINTLGYHLGLRRVPW